MHLADSRPGAAREVAAAHASARHHGHSTSTPPTARICERHASANGIEAVVSRLPYYCNDGVAEAARATGCHYFDLTEDVRSAATVQAVATGAPTAFAPQCGLAPGFVSIAAAELIRHFQSCAP